MIKNFANKLTADIFDGINSRHARKMPRELHAKARRLLDQINAARFIDTLKAPPKNKLAKLSGNLSGYWRIKIDQQWAIIFQWENSNAYNLSIVDYH